MKRPALYQGDRGVMQPEGETRVGLRLTRERHGKRKLWNNAIPAKLLEKLGTCGPLRHAYC